VLLTPPFCEIMRTVSQRFLSFRQWSPDRGDCRGVPYSTEIGIGVLLHRRGASSAGEDFGDRQDDRAVDVASPGVWTSNLSTLALIAFRCPTTASRRGPSEPASMILGDRPLTAGPSTWPTPRHALRDSRQPSSRSTYAAGSTRPGWPEPGT
jgi:hypothetical protein